MARYVVSASWLTPNGGANWHTETIEADSPDQACEMMAAKVKRDKRRKVHSGLRTKAEPVP